MKFGNIVPILRSFDEAKAKEFHVDFLGFSVDWESRFFEDAPLYMQLSLVECAIHISEHHGDCSPGSQVRIQCDKIEEYNKELISKNYKYSKHEVEDKPWGCKEMTIADPFGNRITFSGESRQNSLLRRTLGAHCDRES